MPTGLTAYTQAESERPAADKRELQAESEDKCYRSSAEQAEVQRAGAGVRWRKRRSYRKRKRLRKRERRN